METEGTAVPPSAVSGRRYKACVPWRFQPGFVRQQPSNHAAAATPRGSGGGAPAGGSGAKGCGSPDPEPRRATRSATAKGSDDGEKMESGARRKAKKGYQLKTGTPIVVIDSSGGGFAVVDSPDGAKMENGAGSEAVKSPVVVKIENTPLSGAENNCQMKRATRSATAKSSDMVKMETEMDCQFKRETGSSAAKSSSGEKMENSAHSGAKKGCQSKRGTHSATVKSSDGEKLENDSHTGVQKDCGVNCASEGSKKSRVNRSGLKSNIPVIDLVGEEPEENGGSMGNRAPAGATVKSSNGEKLENSAHTGAQKDCGENCASEGSKKPRVNWTGLKSNCPVIDLVGEEPERNGGSMENRAHTGATVKSSNGENSENSAHTGARKDCGENCTSEGSKKSRVNGTGLKSNCPVIDLEGEEPEGSGGSMGNRAHAGATVKSSNGEKLENSAHTGAQKDCGENCASEGSKKSRVNGTGLNSNCPVIDLVGEELEGNGGSMGNRAHTGATVKSSDGEKLENSSHTGAQKDFGENCVSEGLKKSCLNGSGLKSNCPAADLVGEEPEGNGGSMANRAAKKIIVADKGCSSAGPAGNVSYCRKGRKELVPWRFQIGYKRSFSTAFCSNSRSPETPEYRAQGSSTQCTPGTRSTVRCYASPQSSVRVSAVRNFSSGKSEKETGSAYKKMRTDNNDHNQGMPETRVSLARETVMKALKHFRLIYKKLSNELDKPKESLDLQAYRIFRDRFSAQCDDKKYVGNVPGIHVGDIFHVRVELCVVGLHRPHRIGIDHVKEADGTCIAVSIVAYARFSDVKNNLDALVYTGSMTATINQKIDGTNLALKKSMDTSTPVRVIHGSSTKGKNMHIYGGLYLVEKYWRERESEDCYVYKFRLRRMAGQKHIDIEEILKSGHSEPEGVIMNDISQGLERIPIPVVNSISNECPMPYVYMSRLKYPHNYQPAPPAGCGCVGGCSDSKLCACAAKNGGKIPFNDKGCIIRAKPLVYECGPSCKCPPTCHNRVGQKGMKFRLLVFKTKSMGWGVKTLDFIPSGSFVCEYIGEVLDDEEAQNRMTDEYLFAIGHNYYDEALWEGLSRSIPSLQKGHGEDEDAGFAVDASNMGNFAKFINHSCAPNLYAQNVLYDHDDKSAPHIMFFACEDIPPSQELAYHYNYAIDQVHDANGNIKKKKCLCGSKGWMAGCIRFRR